MHFRLPKPLHGWREFIGEVGIIVVGVLIALAAEQLVETIHWKSQVAEARTALGVEISDSLGQAIEREKLSRCVNKRLDEISVILSQASRSGRLPAVGDIGRPPFRTWVDNSWQSTMAGQTASHFDRHELSQLSVVYDFVRRASQASEEELQAWTDLQSIIGPGRPVSADEIGVLVRAVERARAVDAYISVYGLRLRQIADRVPLPYDQATIAEAADRPLSNQELCTPISADVPPQYGHSSFERALQIARKSSVSIR